MDHPVGFFRRHRAALTIAAVGAAVTVVAALALAEGLEHRAIERLDRDAGHMSGDLTAAFEAAIGRVEGLRALYDASESVTEIEFARFTTRVGGSPGLVGLGVAVWVPHAEVDEFEEAAIADRSWFRVDGHEAAPPGHRHLIVWYANPFRVIPRGLGFDLSSDPARADAIERLSSEPAPVVSGFVDVAGTGGSTVEIYAPVDVSGGEAGAVFGILDFTSVLDEEIQTMGAGVETARLTDVTGVPTAGPVRAPDRWEDDIELGSRTLRLHVTSEEESVARTWAPLAVLVGGLSAAMLAGLIGFHRSRARERDIEIRHLLRSAEEKDVFLASVSHELRTPLTSVLGLTGIMVHDWDQLSPGEVRDYVVMAHNEANELTDLVEDLLTIGRVEAGAITFANETVDLRAEVTHVVARVITDREVTIDLDAAYASADPLRVRQILRNLVNNAVRYGHSRIDIACSGEVMVDLIVRNDGPPIDPAQLPHLFSPYQGRQRRRGQPESIGLGLHISRRLARGMGGDLAYDYVDGWCVFRLSLPSAGAPLPEPEDVTASTG